MILTRYGATEFSAPFKVLLDPEGTPEGSVGEVAPGVEVKLSEGDEGKFKISALALNAVVSLCHISRRLWRSVSRTESSASVLLPSLVFAEIRTPILLMGRLG